MSHIASSDSDQDRDILALNQTLLEAAARGDWATYANLCSPSLSCFEAETNGQLVEGLAFHRFYFPDETSHATAGSSADVTVTMARPHVRWLGSNAVVLSYTRLVQRMSNGEAVTSSSHETRIWQREENSWRLVHVHRS